MKQKSSPVTLFVKEMSNLEKPISNLKKNNETSETKGAESQITLILKEHLTNEMFASILHIIHTPRILLKIFLTLFLLVAMSLFAYTTVNLFLSYFDYSVTTITRNIYETPTNFPKVTVCNVNQFTTKFSFNYLQQLYVMQNGSLSYVDTSLSRYQRNQNANMERNILNGLAINFTDAEKKLLAHDFGDVLLGCQFNFQKCSVDDFFWSFDLNYGNCYSFNSGFNATGGTVPLKQSNIAGNG